MTTKVDLNSDMGEGYGAWTIGNDDALLGIVTSANIACGFHAGDPDVMMATMKDAVARGVGIGAHPGFADLRGFGRRQMHLSHEEVGNLIAYQVGAAKAMAERAGGELRHFKLHGALSNMASTDTELARICYQAALDVDPKLTIMVLAATVMEDVARNLYCSWAGEIFADRAYNDDATLVGRHIQGAVITDADAAAKRVLAMVKADAIIAESGKEIACRIDTVCLHGDTPGAVEMAAKVREVLEGADIRVQRL